MAQGEVKGAELSKDEKDARWNARLARMSPQQRVAAEARRAENAKKRAQAEAAEAPSARPRKAALSGLLGRLNGKADRALEAKVARLEEELKTVRTDMKDLRKDVRKLVRQQERRRATSRPG